MFAKSKLGTVSVFGTASATSVTNQMNDFEVVSPPKDSVATMEFSPRTLQQNLLIAGGWDNIVRCWEVEQTGKSLLKSMQTLRNAVLDVCWSDDGTKVFVAACDKKVKMWDLASDQMMEVATHDAAVSTCHWVKGSNYTGLMTGSWDKTLKFWDTRSPNPMMVIPLPERCYCADVNFPMAVVGTAGHSISVYSLENNPIELKCKEDPLNNQYRVISIFEDKNNIPIGYAAGSAQGRVAIVYADASQKNYTFKCHGALNDLAFHPIYGTLATVGSDGSFCFWNKDTRTKLKSSKTLDLSITNCAFNANGQIFAYAAGYDWAKGHDSFNPMKKPKIFFRPYEEPHVC